MRTALLATAALALFSATALAQTPDKPPYNHDFDAYWGDQKAEIAGYDLTTPRYGQSRHGVAVLITVTEPFSDSLRVKPDPGNHPDADVFPALKLNVVEDFQTGIYDYNLMTSAFVALKPVNDLPVGSPTKVTFSCQEWCGQVYQHVLFDAGQLRTVSHSYFDKEADQQHTMKTPKQYATEDTLFLWSRGLAAPFISAGQSLDIPVLKSLRTVRLLHQPLDFVQGHLERKSDSETAETPAGKFDCEVRTARLPDRTWTFYVEKAHPNHLVKWTTTDGEQALLTGAIRTQYWSQHNEGDEKLLAQIGLHPRPPRTD